MTPDRQTYVLDPCTRIWKALIGKTIVFLAPQAKIDWRDSRAYKYVVREDDLNKSASDMDLYMDSVRGEDYVTRPPYAASVASSRSDSPADAKSESYSPPTPSPDKPMRPPTPERAPPRVKATDSKEERQEDAPQPSADSASMPEDAKRLKTTPT